MTKIRTTVSCLAFAMSVFAATATAALAQDFKVPETAADHEALAKKYKDDADKYRKTAEEHKKMATEYGNTKNPWHAKMQKHCKAIVKDAEKLAADAEKAAEYHTLRGKEVQGK